MSNNSTIATERQGTNLVIWLVCEVTSLVLTVNLLYLFASLLIQSLRRKIIKSSRNSEVYASSSSAATSGLSSLEGQRSKPKRTKSNLQNQRLIYIIIFCLFIGIIRVGLEQAIVWGGTYSDKVCDSLSKAMVVFTSLCLHLTHVFMWYRQFIFYQDPLLKPLTSTTVRFLSKYAYFGMLIAYTVNLVVYLKWRNNAVIRNECRGAGNNYSTYVTFGLLVGSCVMIQLTLSILFLYPLISQRVKAKRLHQPKSKQDNDLSRQDKLLSQIQRVLVGTSIGVLSDLAGAIVIMFLPDDIPMFIINTLYSCDILLNIICLLCTFTDWKQKIIFFIKSS